MDLSSLLERKFGFTSFRPGQREVIDAVIERKAALAVFPTGAGKSLCYQLPALTLEGVTLVVSPLIALMKDQIDFVSRRGIAAARLDSSLSLEESRAISDQLRRGTLDLLYVAPERFNNERFLSMLERTRIALFAVDEAHCISEWGHNFRPDYLKLAEFAKTIRAERILALTATATPAVVDDICQAFEIPKECAIVTGFYRPNLALLATAARDDRTRAEHLIDALKTRPKGPTIIYVTLQRTAEQLAAKLCDAELHARAYHAGMETEDRTRVQDEWMASDRGIVVATIAFGMGIDKANVRYVYHYNLPKSLESYSQEIGRAGRDDRPSTVEVLVSMDDLPTLENFAFGDTPTESSLRGLVSDLLSRGDELDIAQTELSVRHDLRPLVLKTALTYLELLGVFRQGTPYYDTYKIKPLIPLEELPNKFEGERATFIDAIFAHSKTGRTWTTVNTTEIAAALGQDRSRITRALDYLDEKGWIELSVADVRQRYRRLRPSEDEDALVADLCQKFMRREEREIERLREVIHLFAGDRCFPNVLAAHFGEARETRCGQCTHCRTGIQLPLAEPEPLPPPSESEAATINGLRSEHPRALAEPRQVARFLAGLPSPATSKAKLTRHDLFGAFGDRRFEALLEWVGG